MQFRPNKKKIIGRIITRNILFHDKRHPKELTAEDLETNQNYLAAEKIQSGIDHCSKCNKQKICFLVGSFNASAHPVIRMHRMPAAWLHNLCRGKTFNN
jgi:hypothetical protein